MGNSFDCLNFEFNGIKVVKNVQCVDLTPQIVCWYRRFSGPRKAEGAELQKPPETALILMGDWMQQRLTSYEKEKTAMVRMAVAEDSKA